MINKHESSLLSGQDMIGLLREGLVKKVDGERIRRRYPEAEKKGRALEPKSRASSQSCSNKRVYSESILGCSVESFLQCSWSRRRPKPVEEVSS